MVTAHQPRRCSPPSHGAGFASTKFVETSCHADDVVPLSRSGAVLVRRPIDGGGHDLAGPYPLLVVPRPAGLAADLAELDGGPSISVTAVIDPLSCPDAVALGTAFPDLLVPFKRHHLVDLTDGAHSASAHHRRYARRAHRSLTIERCDDTARVGDALVVAYAALRARVELSEGSDLTPDELRRQVALDGVSAWIATADGVDLAVALWVRDGRFAWYHLAAATPAGREAWALFGLMATALSELRDDGVELVDLGGPAGTSDRPGDGLDAFKAGWSTHHTLALLGGRVLDRDRYDRLSEGVDTSWFPAYRAGRRPITVTGSP